MAQSPVDHMALALALSGAQDWLKSLQERHLLGLVGAQRSLEEALAAGLQEEERLWARARAERLQLQGELAALQNANEEAARVGAARIEALRQQLNHLHTCLLAAPSTERAQEARDLLARASTLSLQLTWASFMPSPQGRLTHVLGQLQLEERVLSLATSKILARGNGEGRGGGPAVPAEGSSPEGGNKEQASESCPSELPRTAPSVEAGLASQGEMCSWAEEMGTVAEVAVREAEGREGALPAEAMPTVSAGVPTTCSPGAEEVGGAARPGPSLPEGSPDTADAPGTPLPLEPATLFRARAIWVQEDASDSSSSGEMGASGPFREVAVLGSRAPSARGALPRWASAESLGRLHRARQGAGGQLGGSCLELAGHGAERVAFLKGTRLGWGEPPSPHLKCVPAVRHHLGPPSPPCNRLVGQWGAWGSREGQLCLPHGLCAAPAGSLFVVDFGNRRLQEVGRGGGRALPLPGKAYFDVARGRGGCVALTSPSWRRVELYSARGRLLQALAEGFQSPRGISLAPRGEFLVADTRLGVLHVLGVSGGRLVRREAVGGFTKPYLVATNSRGEVAVSERGLDGGCCVKVLAPTWQLLRVLGGQGRPPLLTNPWGVSLDEAGRVVVADWGRLSHAVFCYPPRGRGWAVATEGLSSPRGVALLGERHLVVADSMHHCLKTFQYC
ncbi:Hypothetical predicted protein [Podarcis lilfordi]|uniref:NHL repeat containing 4 n=1 Tax=Podarcis lilfordi TaxID=74358 RepID=A0AA35KAB5_9SAUR|nr:Hypothetical predicted protein [Podarcis lilfordi]